MKTRIKIIEKNNGEIRYYPIFSERSKAVLWLLLFIPILGWWGIIEWFKYEHFRKNDIGLVNGDVCFSDLKKRQTYIDKELELKNDRRNEAYLKKIKSTTYIKYP